MALGKAYGGPVGGEILLLRVLTGFTGSKEWFVCSNTMTDVTYISPLPHRLFWLSLLAVNFGFIPILRTHVSSPPIPTPQQSGVYHQGDSLSGFYSHDVLSSGNRKCWKPNVSHLIYSGKIHLS